MHIRKRSKVVVLKPDVLQVGVKWSAVPCVSSSAADKDANA